MRVSVVIPAYNAERYVGKAIESCLNQSYPPHEIIVVDDASTDGSAAVAELYPEPVRVIRLKENSGVSVARNRGVEVSTGNWIAFLDADDWWMPEKLERQRQCAFENPRAMLLYTGFRILPVDGPEYDGQFFAPREIWPMLRYRSRIHLSTVITRRDAFDAVGGFNSSLRIAQDWDLWLRLAARYSAELFDAVPEPLVVYRRVSGSLSTSAMRYFHERKAIMKSTCLIGTSGFSRYLWRRRVLAYNYYDTSQSLREEGSLFFLPFMLMSFAYWPFRCIAMPNRYKTAIVMAMQTCSRVCKTLVGA